MCQLIPIRTLFIVFIIKLYTVKYLYITLILLLLLEWIILGCNSYPTNSPLIITKIQKLEFIGKTKDVYKVTINYGAMAFRTHTNYKVGDTIK